MDRLVRNGEEERELKGRFVRLKKGEEKPENARLMTHAEVLDMQKEVILAWKPRYEMWPFSWGLGMLGGAAAVSGMYINNHLRYQLGLTSMARFGTFLPMAALPAMLASVFHSLLVTQKILVGDFPCTVCASTRSGSIQAVAGTIYPMMLGPIICIINARKYHTEYVPGIRDTSAFLPFLRRIMPKSGMLLALVLANFGMGMAVSERENFLFAKYLSPTLEKSQDEEYFQ